MVDFDRYKREHGKPGEWIKMQPGAYLAMEEIPGAVAAIRHLAKMGYEPIIATKPPTGVSHAYAEKAQWVLNHMPEMQRHIILTHDKGLLGDHGDFLIDDRPHKANCTTFKGKLLIFCENFEWDQIIDYFIAILMAEAKRGKD